MEKREVNDLQCLSQGSGSKPSELSPSSQKEKTERKDPRYKVTPLP
jgi:hypothetical protein